MSDNSNGYFHPGRRRQLRRMTELGLLSWLISSGYAQAENKAKPALKELRIGFQKSSVNFTLLKQRKSLDGRLAGTQISWFEFTAGPQMLEALSVGSVDLAMTGEPPPIFAQAAGSSLVYIGAEPAKPETSAILVKPESSLQQLADLKGKRVAFQKGSSAHYHVLRAIQAAGLQWSEFSPVYLAPADARAAFERGSVDAWAIWDPYWAAFETSSQSRVLATGQGLISNLTYYLAARQLAENYPQVIQVLFEELTRSERSIVSERKQAVAIVAQSTGLDQASIERFLQRRPASPVVYITPQMIVEQQKVADQFYQQKLLPKPVKIRDAVWLPASLIKA